MTQMVDLEIGVIRWTVTNPVMRLPIVLVTFGRLIHTYIVHSVLVLVS